MSDEARPRRSGIRALGIDPGSLSRAAYWLFGPAFVFMPSHAGGAIDVDSPA